MISATSEDGMDDPEAGLSPSIMADLGESDSPPSEAPSTDETDPLMDHLRQMEEGLFRYFIAAFKNGDTLNAALAGVLRQYIHDVRAWQEQRKAGEPEEDSADLTLEGLRRLYEASKKGEDSR